MAQATTSSYNSSSSENSPPKCPYFGLKFYYENPEIHDSSTICAKNQTKKDLSRQYLESFLTIQDDYKLKTALIQSKADNNKAIEINVTPEVVFPSDLDFDILHPENSRLKSWCASDSLDLYQIRAYLFEYEKDCSSNIIDEIYRELSSVSDPNKMVKQGTGTSQEEREEEPNFVSCNTQIQNLQGIQTFNSNLICRESVFQFKHLIEFPQNQFFYQNEVNLFNMSFAYGTFGNSIRSRNNNNDLIPVKMKIFGRIIRENNGAGISGYNEHLEMIDIQITEEDKIIYLNKSLSIDSDSSTWHTFSIANLEKTPEFKLLFTNRGCRLIDQICFRLELQEETIFNVDPKNLGLYEACPISVGEIVNSDKVDKRLLTMDDGNGYDLNNSSSSFLVCNENLIMESVDLNVIGTTIITTNNLIDVYADLKLFYTAKPVTYPFTKTHQMMQSFNRDVEFYVVGSSHADLMNNETFIQKISLLETNRVTFLSENNQNQIVQILNENTVNETSSLTIPSHQYLDVRLDTQVKVSYEDCQQIKYVCVVFNVTSEFPEYWDDLEMNEDNKYEDMTIRDTLTEDNYICMEKTKYLSCYVYTKNMYPYFLNVYPKLVDFSSNQTKKVTESEKIKLKSAVILKERGRHRDWYGTLDQSSFKIEYQMNNQSLSMVQQTDQLTKWHLEHMEIPNDKYDTQYKLYSDHNGVSDWRWCYVNRAFWTGAEIDTEKLSQGSVESCTKYEISFNHALTVGESDPLLRETYLNDNQISSHLYSVCENDQYHIVVESILIEKLQESDALDDHLFQFFSGTMTKFTMINIGKYDLITDRIEILPDYWIDITAIYQGNSLKTGKIYEFEVSGQQILDYTMDQVNDDGKISKVVDFEAIWQTSNLPSKIKINTASNLKPVIIEFREKLLSDFGNIATETPIEESNSPIQIFKDKIVRNKNIFNSKNYIGQKVTVWYRIPFQLSRDILTSSSIIEFFRESELNITNSDGSSTIIIATSLDNFEVAAIMVDSQEKTFSYDLFELFLAQDLVLSSNQNSIKLDIKFDGKLIYTENYQIYASENPYLEIFNLNVKTLVAEKDSHLGRQKLGYNFTFSNKLKFIAPIEYPLVDVRFYYQPLFVDDDQKWTSLEYGNSLLYGDNFYYRNDSLLIKSIVEEVSNEAQVDSSGIIGEVEKLYKFQYYDFTKGVDLSKLCGKFSIGISIVSILDRNREADYRNGFYFENSCLYKNVPRIVKRGDLMTVIGGQLSDNGIFDRLRREPQILNQLYMMPSLSSVIIKKSSDFPSDQSKIASISNRQACDTFNSVKLEQETIEADYRGTLGFSIEIKTSIYQFSSNHLFNNYPEFRVNTAKRALELFQKTRNLKAYLVFRDSDQIIEKSGGPADLRKHFPNFYQELAISELIFEENIETDAGFDILATGQFEISDDVFFTSGYYDKESTSASQGYRKKRYPWIVFVMEQTKSLPLLCYDPVLSQNYGFAADSAIAIHDEAKVRLTVKHVEDSEKDLLVYRLENEQEKTEFNDFRSFDYQSEAQRLNFFKAKTGRRLVIQKQALCSSKSSACKLDKVRNQQFSIEVHLTNLANQTKTFKSTKFVNQRLFFDQKINFDDSGLLVLELDPIAYQSGFCLSNNNFHLQITVQDLNRMENFHQEMLPVSFSEDDYCHKTKDGMVFVIDHFNVELDEEVNNQLNFEVAIYVDPVKKYQDEWFWFLGCSF